MVEFLDLIQVHILQLFIDVPADCLLTSQGPAVVPQVCTKQTELINRFWWNFISENFMKNC